MKATIAGSRYDTSKAVEIGRTGSKLPPTHFNWWEASLYRTPRSGAYFLAGRGQAATIFGRNADNHLRKASERIIPLTREEALAWASQYLNLNADKIQAAFGDTISDA